MNSARVLVYNVPVIRIALFDYRLLIFDSLGNDNRWSELISSYKLYCSLIRNAMTECVTKLSSCDYLRSPPPLGFEIKSRFFWAQLIGKVFRGRGRATHKLKFSIFYHSSAANSTRSVPKITYAGTPIMLAILCYLKMAFFLLDWYPVFMRWILRIFDSLLGRIMECLKCVYIYHIILYSARLQVLREIS